MKKEHCFIVMVICILVNLIPMYSQDPYLVVKDNRVSIMKNGELIQNLVVLNTRYYEESFVYKFISNEEVVFILDEIVSVTYNHFKFDGFRWKFQKFIPLGPTPRGRLEGYGILPRNYNEIKDIETTFKINGVEDVDVFQNGEYFMSIDFESWNKRREEFLKRGQEFMEKNESQK